MEIEKRNLIFGILFLALAFAFVLNISKVDAVGEAVVCCEKTTSGAWCQEVTDESQCDISGSLRSAPTSCESTKYCETGTCVNTIDGLCMDNTAQVKCESPIGGKALGLWYDAEPGDIPQCQLGCCLLGDQASFTTQVRCKQLSSEYGLETNYRADIRNEVECIASASPQTKGACVIEEDFERTCRLTTKSECNNLKSSNSGNIDFHPGFLCSAESLATNCGPSKKTTLIDGRDEVFFVDTCGNPANIYDAKRQDEPDCASGSTSSTGSCGYWERIVPKTQSCVLDDDLGNANECGNCNYFLGSSGGAYERGEDEKSPTYGDYLCKDLSCGNVDGEKRDHGETWCVNSAARDSLKNAPGSRDFRKVCYNGEVTVEPCADYRAETCVDSFIETTGGDRFSTAACRVNMWQDCSAQDNEKDCTNEDRRDCTWVPPVTQNHTTNSPLGEHTIEEEIRPGKCVPTNSPGFDFWSSESDAASICVQADDQCVARFKKSFVDNDGNFIEDIAGLFETDFSPVFECESGCECVGLKTDDPLDRINAEKGDFVERANNICTAIGDCGVTFSYANSEGYYNLGDLATVINPEDEQEQ